MNAGVARGALRRVGQVALLALLSLLLLEVVLQVASLVVPSRGGAERAPEDGRRTVLCVGDSFTYGLGASSHEAGAYPAQLQRQLDDAAPSTWRVVNAGFPGRNSRGVLERIDAQLERVRPAFVCILVGLNDRWSHPERLDLSATPSASVSDDRAWRFELRTLRLWKLVLNQFRGETAAAPAWESDPLPALVATLPAGDPALAADASPEPTASVAMPSDDEKAEIAALSLQPDAAAENLPRLRAAARACVAGCEARAACERDRPRLDGERPASRRRAAGHGHARSERPARSPRVRAGTARAARARERGVRGALRLATGRRHLASPCER
jgi:hypothetical protein